MAWKYEWLWDDSRLVIYDWIMVSDLYGLCTGKKEFLSIANEDEFITAMRNENITAVQVTNTIRYFEGKPRRNYWVLSFTSNKQAFLFKFKYAQMFL